MATTNSAPDATCPTVPALGAGTVGRTPVSTPGVRDSDWDDSGRVNLKALADQWYERQRNRDATWDDAGTVPIRTCPTLHRLVGHLSDAQAAEVIARELARPGWSARDWQAFFDERAAIAEHDQALGRHQAERAAYVQCIHRFLVRHPPGYRPDLQCLHCGDMVIKAESVPIVCPDNLQRWVHKRCAVDYRLRRIEDARVCLERLGIIDPAVAAKFAGEVGRWIAGL
jgi:hypothetical protein